MTMKKVVIPSKVKINKYSFKVTAIAAKAFKGSKKLQSVTVGKNIRMIGKQAFRGCGKLKYIQIKSLVLKEVGKSAFKGIRGNAVIKVPAKKRSLYQKKLKNRGQKSTVRIK